MGRDLADLSRLCEQKDKMQQEMLGSSGEPETTWELKPRRRHTWRKTDDGSVVGDVS